MGSKGGAVNRQSLINLLRSLRSAAALADSPDVRLREVVLFPYKAHECQAASKLGASDEPNPLLCSGRSLMEWVECDKVMNS
jgi:hypothetical protein